MQPGGYNIGLQFSEGCMTRLLQLMNLRKGLLAEMQREGRTTKRAIVKKKWCETLNGGWPFIGRVEYDSPINAKLINKIN